MTATPFSSAHTTVQMQYEAGSALMLINKNNYKALLDILVQVKLRGQLTRDEAELLSKFVDVY